MNLDVEKTNPTPKDGWQAIDLLVIAQGKLTDALFIMSSALEYDSPDGKEINDRRMSEFIKQFEKD